MDVWHSREASKRQQGARIDVVSPDETEWQRNESREAERRGKKRTPSGRGRAVDGGSREQRFFRDSTHDSRPPQSLSTDQNQCMNDAIV